MSVVFELAEVEAAVRGARVLSELVVTDSVPEIGGERAVLRAVVASLNLLEARLALVGRVLRGATNVVELAAPHNRVAEDARDAGLSVLRLRPVTKARRTP